MKQKIAKAHAQDEIDATIVAEADKDEAWEKAIPVRRSKKESLSLPAELARRAAFFARLHRRDVSQWLAKVIEERLDLEEAAFAGAKRELRATAAKS